MLGCLLHLSACRGAGAEQGLMESVHPKASAELQRETLLLHGSHLCGETQLLRGSWTSLVPFMLLFAPSAYSDLITPAQIKCHPRLLSPNSQLSNLSPLVQNLTPY